MRADSRTPISAREASPDRKFGGRSGPIGVTSMPKHSRPTALSSLPEASAEPADSPIMEAQPTGQETGQADAVNAPTPPCLTHTDHSPRWLRRLLLVAGGICAFALVGSLINPDWSQAGEDDELRSPRVSRGASGRPDLGAGRSMPIVEASLLLGTLECREYRILIHHADPVPLYTVCSPDGRVLRENMEAGDVYREFPTIDLERLRFEPTTGEKNSGALMLVYPLD